MSNKPRKFLVIIDDSIDTRMDWFDQIVGAFEDNGISATIHEVDEDDSLIGEKPLADYDEYEEDEYE